jgi:NADPH:quinone reductase-like Zn-dependent oxidoreductase
MTGKIIEYGLYGDPPKILGIDLAGVIEEVGPDVKGYKKGDRMYPPDPS